MRFTIYLILTFMLIGCSNINRENELNSKIERLQIINDSLSKIIDDSNGSILNSVLKIIPSDNFIAIGDTMRYQVLINIQRMGDIYPYLYYSDSCLLNESELPFKLLAEIDSVKMLDWQANISIPQNKLGLRNIYFMVKRLNHFGELEEYRGWSEFPVITKTDSEKIERILNNIKKQ